MSLTPCSIKALTQALGLAEEDQGHMSSPSVGSSEVRGSSLALLLPLPPWDVDPEDGSGDF